ncbi:DrsE family protein [Candidatus Mancarchaeum acidiphilum]|uniref:DrsE family protein n=1 Tax=Candidatus Mancarchaeum acidiphilum TaxID=1920749 RepID=A0A218NMK5_9ARCH|nr:hypothetical protein [Candidatus Mancarchaeum acidiphilum]ASI13710.1 DrsE family protein [Candidatus Mancarchaeum acidiphilum]
MAKILSIVMSGEKAKIKMALNFTSEMLKQGKDVKLMFWGPSEGVIAEDAELQEGLKKVSEVLHPLACINFARNNNLEEKLKGKVDLQPIGKYIAESVDDGYSILSF